MLCLEYELDGKEAALQVELFRRFFFQTVGSLGAVVIFKRLSVSFPVVCCFLSLECFYRLWFARFLFPSVLFFLGRAFIFSPPPFGKDYQVTNIFGKALNRQLDFFSLGLSHLCFS